MLDYLKALLQYCLPNILLSSLMHKLANSQVIWFKNLVILFLIKKYKININESEIKDPKKYISINHFFTRKLDKGSRNISRAEWVSPVDGYIRENRKILGETLIQAKNIPYSLCDLLHDSSLAKLFNNGFYQNIYLSPQDYHRVHMPKSAKLLQANFIAGNLFAVNNASNKFIKKLYARNERLAMIFESKNRSNTTIYWAMVMVGANLVGSIETVFTGIISPPHAKENTFTNYKDKNLYFNKGEEIAKFNMGSTVILITDKNCSINKSVIPELSKIYLGQSLIKPK